MNEGTGTKRSVVQLKVTAVKSVKPGFCSGSGFSSLSLQNKPHLSSTGGVCRLPGESGLVSQKELI